MILPRNYDPLAGVASNRTFRAATAVSGSREISLMRREHRIAANGIGSPAKHRRDLRRS